MLILILLKLVFLDVSFSIPDEGKDTLLEKLDILVRVQKLLQTGKILTQFRVPFFTKIVKKDGL